MKIFYFYDALCGWCYGFSPVFNQFYNKYKDEYDFEVISGGMMTGERAGPIGAVAPYIKSAYKDVESRTGIEFGKEFLENVLEKGTTVFSSLPPALALTAFRQIRAKDHVTFAGMLQKAIYYDGMAPEDLEGYAKLAASFGVDEGDFQRRMTAEDNTFATKEDFMFTQQLGVQGFPMVVLCTDEEKYYLISHGYVPAQMLEDQFNSALRAARSTAGKSNG